MLEQIKQALEKATDNGMWNADGEPWPGNENLQYWISTQMDGIACAVTAEDAHLIANAPDWLRYLLGEVERLQEREFNHYPITILALESRIDEWEDFANHLTNITSCSMTKNEIRQALNTFAERSDSK